MVFGCTYWTMERLIANHYASLTYGSKISKLLVLKGKKWVVFCKCKPYICPLYDKKIQRFKVQRELQLLITVWGYTILRQSNTAIREILKGSGQITICQSKKSKWGLVLRTCKIWFLVTLNLALLNLANDLINLIFNQMM